MAHRKAGGSAKNLRDSNPSYLGVKKNDNEKVSTGQIIIRQRGTYYMPGDNVGIGKDHTLFALKDGVISFKSLIKKTFTGAKKKKKIIHVR